jgi:hypothetical protein
MMMNDVFVVSQSQHLAERLRKESPGDLRGQITRAWRLLYGAGPTDTELRESLMFLAEEAETIRARAGAVPESSKKSAAPDIQLQSLASLCQALLAANRFLYLD